MVVPPIVSGSSFTNSNLFDASVNAGVIRLKLLMTDLQKRIQSVDWDSFSHPCYPSSHLEQVPGLLLSLFDSTESVAQAAINKLSHMIAHQGNAGSISVPALPFLIERIEQGSPSPVLEELMVVVYSFSHYLSPIDTSQWNDSDWALARRSFNYPDDYNWTCDIRKILIQKLERFRELVQHPNEEIADYAKMTLENLAPYCNT